MCRDGQGRVGAPGLREHQGAVTALPLLGIHGAGLLVLMGIDFL